MYQKALYFWITSSILLNNFFNLSHFLSKCFHFWKNISNMIRIYTFFVGYTESREYMISDILKFCSLKFMYHFLDKFPFFSAYIFLILNTKNHIVLPFLHISSWFWTQKITYFYLFFIYLPAFEHKKSPIFKFLHMFRGGTFLSTEDGGQTDASNFFESAWRKTRPSARKI